MCLVIGCPARDPPQLAKRLLSIATRITRAADRVKGHPKRPSVTEAVSAAWRIADARGQISAVPTAKCRLWFWTAHSDRVDRSLGAVVRVLYARRSPKSASSCPSGHFGL